MRLPGSTNEGLIFDIGLHHGDDSAYYLSLGYRVVGVEANPLLAIECKLRFESEIDLGLMEVVNAGVWKEPGEFIFHRNLSDDGWSSFLPQKGKKGGLWEELKIPCVTTKQLVDDYGKPVFMKVDIEDADFQALLSITSAMAPDYVSVELNCTDPILEKLIELGYSAFKFVNGETYRTSPPIFNHEIGWRLLRKIGRLAPFVREGICRLPQSLRAKSEYDAPGKYSPAGYPFGRCHSGPFGEFAAGPWLTRAAAHRWLEDLKTNYRRGNCQESFWWDIHARHSRLILDSRAT